MDREPMAMTRLLLVRHGQTELSHNDAFCGTTEAPLTVIGRDQAQQLAKRLSHEHIDALYCSPQGRAYETAKPIASMLGLEIQTRKSLREMNFGLWEGRVQAEVAVESPQEMAAWDRGSWMVQLPEGETQQAVLARVVPCIVELLTVHSGQTILLVSHRTTLRLLIGHILNLSLPNSRELSLDPASLSKLLVIGDQVQLVLFNDISQLT
ncbi:MAG: alpha-ribazole phosphatase [Ktedonobacteraceae bacterium]